MDSMTASLTTTSPTPSCASFFAPPIPTPQAATRSLPRSPMVFGAVQQMLAATVQQGAALLMVASTGGVIEYVNPGFVRATGYTAGDVLGRNVAAFLHKGALCAGYPAMLQAVRGRRPWCGLLRLRRRRGGCIPLVALLSVTGDPHLDNSRVIAFAHVLAEPASVEPIQPPRQQRSPFHNAMVGHVAAALSHELNQPLGALVNYHGGILRRLRAGTLSDGHLKDALHGASIEAERAKTIMRTIARFVRTPPQPLATHDINSILRAVAAAMAREAGQNQATLSLDLARQLPAVSLNLMEIEQVLLNLIINSLDSVRDVEPSKRQLVLRSQAAPPDLVRISVCDSGTGFSRDSLQRAFDPFFTTKPQGMGMGLAICYNIIQAHGGRIWAESEPGNGASVRFELPVAGTHHGAC